MGNKLSPAQIRSMAAVLRKCLNAGARKLGYLKSRQLQKQWRETTVDPFVAAYKQVLRVGQPGQKYEVNLPVTKQKVKVFMTAFKNTAKRSHKKLGIRAPAFKKDLTRAQIKDPEIPKISFVRNGNYFKLPFIIKARTVDLGLIDP